MNVRKKTVDKDIFTEFPDAAELLPIWLGGVGKVTVTHLPPNYPNIWINIRIELNNPVAVDKDGFGKYQIEKLQINGHTGHAFGVLSMVSFLGGSPNDGDRVIELRINLELSTNDIPEEQHTFAELESCIRRFAEKLPNGIVW